MSEHDLLRGPFLAGVLALFTPEIDCVRAGEADARLPADDAPRDEPAELDAIVVSATRREEELRHVPMSVHVIDGDWLERRGARGFLDWAYAVPGLSFSQQSIGGTGPIAVIRGISDDVGCCELNPLTALYFGETPVTQAGGDVINFNPAIELLDLDRIEVLRGPQGSYFGASAMGGAIRLIPRAPDPAAPELRFGVRADAVAHGNLGGGGHAVWNQPLGPDNALRAVAFRRSTPGWIEDPGRGREDLNSGDISGLRLATRWQPRENLRIDLSGLRQRVEQDGFNAHDLDLPPWQQSRRVDEFNNDRLGLASLAIDWQGESLQLISNTSYVDRAHALDVDVSPFLAGVFGLPGTLTAANRVGQIETTQELRLLTPAERPWSLLAGLFWQDREHRFDQDFPSPGLVEAMPEHAEYGLGDNLWRGRSKLDQVQRAVYADLSWRPSEHWELSAGGRWFEIERELVGSYVGALGTSDPELRSAESGFAPRASARFELAADASLYLAAAKGFRPGSYNNPAGSEVPACSQELLDLGYPDGIPPEYDFDSLWNYELGARTRWLDGRLHLDAALFHIDWDDIQTQTLLECTGIVFIDNLGQARSRGAELSLAAYPSEQLELEFNLAYTDARYTDGPLAGARIPAVPYLAMNAAATWHFEHPGSLRIEYAQVGDSWMRYTPDPEDAIGGYGLWNLRYQREFERFRVSVGVYNATDQRGRLGVQRDFLGENEALVMPRMLSLALEAPVF